MLEQDEQYLEDRGCLIIRTLCKYINSEQVFQILSTTISVASAQGFDVGIGEQALRLALRADDERDSPHRRRNRRDVLEAAVLLRARAAQARRAAGLQLAVALRASGSVDIPRGR